MSENIAGYIDRSYIKGQTYRYAATPAPIVFTGNIDEISDNDLLSKAMLVSRGQISGGTLPNEFGNTFLITTVKYGNNTYLQTAYLVQSGYECWEYRRIYSGGWTGWVGVDSAIKEVGSNIGDVKKTADAADAAINGTNGINSQISNINGSINTINNTTIPGLSGRIDRADGRITALETDSSIVDISNLYTWTRTSGNWYPVTDSFKAYRSGNVVQIKFVFRGNGNTVGKYATGLLSTLTGGPLPICRTTFTAVIDRTSNPVTVSAIIEENGSVAFTNNGPNDKKWQSTSRIIVSGTFLVSNQNTVVTESPSFVEEYTVIPYN